MRLTIGRTGRQTGGEQSSHILRELEDVLGKATVVGAPAGRRAFCGDGGIISEDPPTAVVLPSDLAGLAKAVRFCHQNGIEAVTRGGATSLRGGAVGGAESIVIATTRFNRITELHRRDRLVRAEAGAMLMALDRAARQAELRLGVGARIGSPATLGGAIAKDICGPSGGAGGSIAALIEGLRVVLADGEIVDMRGGAANWGSYDVAGLVAGAEGALGIIAEATLRLEPLPEAQKLIAAGFANFDAAVEAALALQAQAWRISALDVVSGATMAGAPLFASASGKAPTAVVLTEVEGYAEEVTLVAASLREVFGEHGAEHCEYVDERAVRQRVWEVFDSAPSRLARGRIVGISDVVVPLAKLRGAVGQIDEIAKRHGLDLANCVRAGAGVLQSLFMAPGDTSDGMARVRAAINEAVALAGKEGGLATGSFGAGVLKAASAGYAGLSSADFGIQSLVKTVFDADGIMNRGKVVSP